MDIKAFIESGAIESYVMGLSSPEEMREIDQLRTAYPEIDSAIKVFESSLENNLVLNATAAPVAVREKLMEQLKPEFRQGKLRLINSSSLNSGWKWIAAAAIILLAGSVYYNYYLLKQNKRTEESYALLLADKNNLNARLSEVEKTMTMLNDPAVAKVSMPGTGNHLKNKAMVLWDTRSKNVYFMPMDLPAAPEGKQYQLWALVEGKPVDAGMMNSCSFICTMKNIERADAFAVTLEKTGGSPSPDMSQLYVMGKTNP